MVEKFWWYTAKTDSAPLKPVVEGGNIEDAVSTVTNNLIYSLEGELRQKEHVDFEPVQIFSTFVGDKVLVTVVSKSRK